MSNIILSYKSYADAAYATSVMAYSSQHPNFPATNVLHRWFKKPWRSRYGAGSGNGMFRVTATNKYIDFADEVDELVVNGGMESWASATTLNTWSQYVGGASTINRENSVVKRGTYSCRMNIDAGNNVAYIMATPTIAIGLRYILSVWYKTTGTSTALLQLITSGGAWYLKSDGTWSNVSQTITLPAAANWTRYNIFFTNSTPSTAFELYYLRGNSASQINYLDDVHILPIRTATLTPGDYDGQSLAAHIKAVMDAAGGTYTVTYTESTGLFQISSIAATYIDLLLLSGPNTANSSAGLLGFDATFDRIEYAGYTSDYVRIHSEEELKFDFGAAKTIKAIFLKFNNFQSTATIQLRFYSDAFITLAKTVSITPVTMPILSTDISAYFTNDSYRYVTVWMSDPTNPDFYLELGRVWIYTYFEPHYGFTMERAMTGNDPSVLSFSDDGQAASIQKSRYSEWEYNFDAVKPSEKASFDEIFQYCGTSKPLFICENHHAANPNLRTHYITITGWEWEHLVSKWSTDEHWWKLKIGVREER